MIPTRQRYTLIASLYVSQAVPLGFFIVAMPAILRREGLPLTQVGLLSALAFPWLVKFLWAPLVDRFGSRSFGHYRSWILPLQLASTLAVVGMAFTDLAAGLAPLLVLGGLFNLCSATQDVATDGLAVRTLREAERGTGNGIQVGGYYVGQVLGGGVVLLLFDRFGWTAALAGMALVLALPVIPTLAYREPPYEARPGRPPVDLGALRAFLARPGARVWVAILVVYRAGEAMALTMLNPLLVDRGLSLEQIGLTLGVAGSIASFAGAALGGLLTTRLGRKPSLVAFGLLQAVALSGYLLPAAGFVAGPLVIAVVGAAAFSSGMATAALYTNMMDRCDPHSAATDFSLQQSICALGPLVGAGLSGFSAAALGFGPHFALCILVTLGATALVARQLSARHGAPLAAPAAT